MQLVLLPHARQYKSPATLESLPLRERPAHRVTYAGEACNVAELLAALIGGPRQIETAFALLAKFATVREIARAEVAELTQVMGVGVQTAVRLKAALELGRRLAGEPDAHRLQINSPADSAALLEPLVEHLDQERLYVLLLDTRNRLIGEPVMVYQGSLNTALLRMSEVLRDAVRVNAASVIVAHNHPSGVPAPSPEDVAVTRLMVEAGKLLDIAVLDHVVIGRRRYVSLKERGLGFEK